MDIDDVVSHWQMASDEKWKTAKVLAEKERYADALFFCHLSLEALLKGVYVRAIEKTAPYTHNLLQLAEQSGLELNDEQRRELSEITTFNIRARYDDYKLSLYKKAAKGYSEKYLDITQTLRTWIQTKLQ